MRRTGADRPRSPKSRGSPRSSCRDTAAGQVTGPLHTTGPRRLRWPSRWTISHRRCWSSSSLAMRKTSSTPAGRSGRDSRSSARSSRSLRRNWIATWTFRKWRRVRCHARPGRNPLSRQEDILFRDYHHRHPATRFALLNLAEELSSGNAAGIAAADVGRGRPGSKR